MKLFVIGVSGITGGGKTTLTTALHQFLSDPKNANICTGIHINKVILMHQDKYFYARDSPHHTWIPEINFINREILSAMDMDRFADDVSATVEMLTNDNTDRSTIDQTYSSRTLVNILLIEGFLIYNDQRINKFCQLRFHIYLSYEMGWQRRLIRTFKHINPNPGWYYEHYIWPLYNKHLNEVPNKTDMIFLNGDQHVDRVFDQAHAKIVQFLLNQMQL